MDNLEEVLDALNDFEKKAPKEIPPLLNEYLCRVAKTGETLFPWARLKGFFRAKIDDVMIKYNQDLPSDHLLNSPNVENAKFEEMRARILVALEKFHGAPFTIQRLCELIIEPKRHYKRADKFLRGIEKNVLVVSTVDPFGRKIVSESSKTLVNGLDANGEEQIKTDDGSMTVTPVVSWPTDEVMATWPTQSTDNGHVDSMLTHNGQGDTSSNHSSTQEVPSQSSDTSSYVSSHLEGGDTTTRSSDSSSSLSSGDINPLTSENSKLAPDNTTTSSCTNIEQVNTEINTADHVISDTTCSNTGMEKSVEVTASDCPVGVQPSNDASNNNVCEDNVELTTVTLSADSANDEEESVSTTAPENNPSKPATESLPDTKDLHEGKVTSSEPTSAFSASSESSVADQSFEKVGDEDTVSQSNNAKPLNVSLDNLSDSFTDNVSSSDSRATVFNQNSGQIAEAAPSSEDSNVVSSAQTVMEESPSLSVTDSMSKETVTGKDESVSSQVSRSDEPMDQD